MSEETAVEHKVKRGGTLIALKSGFWYVFSTFITKGLAFITTPIFARLMSKADYGEFINFANWQSMLLIIVSVEMHGTVNRAYYDHKEEFDEYSSSVTIAGVVITIFAYLLFLLNGSWIYRIVSIPEQFVHLMFFTLLFQGCKQIFLAKEKTLYKYRSAAAISLVSLVVPTIVSIIIVALVSEGERLTARMYGFYIPYALVGVYCAYALLKSGRTFKWKYFKYAIVLAIPLVVHYFTTYLLASTNIIITKSVLGAEAAAVVSVVMSIMNIMTILFQSVTGAATTWMMDNLESKSYDKVKKCIIFLTAGVAVTAMMVMILGPEIVTIIGGFRYRIAASLIPGMTLSVFVQILASIFTIILTYDKNVVKTAVITGIVALCSVCAKIFLLSEVGYSVLPLINIVAFAIILVADYILIWKAGYGKCISLKWMMLIVAFVVAVALLCTQIYQGYLIRYAISFIVLVCILVIVLKYKNTLIKLVKKDKAI